MQIPRTTSSRAYSSMNSVTLRAQISAKRSSFDASWLASAGVGMGSPSLERSAVLGHKDRCRVALVFSYEREFPAVSGVIDRDEAAAVSYGILVSRPLFGTDLAPITLDVGV